MKNIWTIGWKDFKTYFTSPIGYIVIGGFLFVMGWMFFFNFNHFAESANKAQMFGQGKIPSIAEGIVRPVYGNMNVMFLLFAPFITMRLFAEERKLQTIQLLMTAPITMGQMVVGKFLASLLLLVTMLAITFVYPIILLVSGNADPGPMITSYIGTFLMSSCYLSMGVLFSAMTENQIVAGILTFAGGLFFWLINWAAQASGPVLSDVLDYLSLIQHYNNFSQGMIHSTDVIFYFSFISAGLFLTYRVLDSYRWRS